MFPQLQGVKRSMCSHRLSLIPFCHVARGGEKSCQVQQCIVFSLSFNKEDQHATTD